MCYFQNILLYSNGHVEWRFHLENRWWPSLIIIIIIILSGTSTMCLSFSTFICPVITYYINTWVFRKQTKGSVLLLYDSGNFCSQVFTQFKVNFHHVLSHPPVQPTVALIVPHLQVITRWSPSTRVLSGRIVRSMLPVSRFLWLVLELYEAAERQWSLSHT